MYIKQDLIVEGSSSIQNISSSTLNIGTNLITVATNDQSARFGGLAVIDSGSLGGSGSFLYDSLQDEFIFVHRGANTAVTSSVVLMGPQTYNSIGSETYLTSNRLVKGTGNEHIVDSNITDTGTLITLGSNTTINGTIVSTGTTLVSGSSQILGGSGIWSSSAQMPAGVVSGSSQVSFTGLSNVPSGLLSGSVLSSYVPFSGATSNLNMGTYDAAATSLYVEGPSGRLGFKQHAGASYFLSGYTTITANGTNYLNFAFAGTEPMYKTFRFDASGLTDLAVRTYTLPDKSGTIATTADVLGTTDSFYIPKVNTISTAFTSSGIFVNDFNDVGIGTTGVSLYGYKSLERVLTINSESSTSSGMLRLQGNGSNKLTITTDNDISTLYAAGALRLYGSSGMGVISINGVGFVGIGTVSAFSGYLQVNGASGTVSIYASNDIVAFSDISVKKNIRPIENVLSRINNSRGILYDRTDDESAIDNIGFIAQELEVQFPELVVTSPDGTKAVKYQNATAVLFEAIKEQQKLIDSILSKLNK